MLCDKLFRLHLLPLLLFSLTAGPLFAGFSGPFFPRGSDGDSSLPVLAQEFPLEAAALAGSGARFENRSWTLAAGGSLRFVQRPGVELIVEGLSADWRRHLVIWDEQDTLLAELSLRDLSAQTGLIPIPNGEAGRWLRLENTASSAPITLRLKVRTYTDAALYPTGWFQTLAITDTRSLGIQGIQGHEDFYYAHPSTTIQVPAAGLVRFTVRKLYGRADSPQDLCLLGISSRSSPLQTVQLKSTLSLYEGADALAVGFAATHFVRVEEGDARALHVELAADCVFTAAFYPAHSNADKARAPQPRLALAPILRDSLLAIEQDDFSERTPLQRYSDILPMRTSESGFAARRSAAQYLRRAYLFFQNLYPNALQADEHLSSQPAVALRRDSILPMNLRTDLMAAPHIKAMLPSCLCLQPSPERQDLTYDNPLNGQASSLRLMIAAGSIKDSVQLLLQLQGSKGVTQSRLRLTPVSASAGAEPVFLTFETPLAADVRTISVAKAAGGSWPLLNMQILTYEDPALRPVDVEKARAASDSSARDLASFLAYLREPTAHWQDQGFAARIQTLRLQLQQKMGALRGETLLPQAGTPRQDAVQLASSLASLRREGQFVLMRTICSAAWKSFSPSQRQQLLEPCLQEALDASHDHLGRAALALMRGTDQQHATALAQALVDSEQPELAAYIFALATTGHDQARTELYALTRTLGWPDATPPWKPRRSPDVLVQYPKTQGVAVPWSQKLGQLFILAPQQSLTLRLDPESNPQVRLDIRSIVPSSQRTLARNWVRFEAEQRTLNLPLLARQLSPDYQLDSRESLSTGTEFVLSAGRATTIRLHAGAQAVAVRLLPPKLQPLPLPDQQDWQVRMFAEDPALAPYEAQLDRLHALLTTGTPEARLQFKAEQLRRLQEDSTQTWAHHQLRQLLEDDTSWNFINAPQAAATIYREEGAYWSPDNPQTKARLQLLPPATAAHLAIIQGDAIQMSEFALTKTQRVRLRLERHVLPSEFNESEPISFKLDNADWTTYELTGDRLDWVRTLPAGVHKLQIRPLQNRPARYIYVSLAALNQNKWQSFPVAQTKFWQGAQRGQPLAFDLEHPTLLRIHALNKGRQELSYRYVPRAGRIVLGQDAPEPIYYRLYALNEDKAAPVYLPNPEAPDLFARDVAAEPLASVAGERPIHSEEGASHRGMTAGIRASSNCRSESEGVRQGSLCASDWSSSAVLSQTLLARETMASWAAALYPGADWLGQLRLAYETQRPAAGINLKLEASALYGRYRSGTKVSGDELSPSLRYTWDATPWDHETQLKLISRRFYHAPEDRRHGLPQALISPWKLTHDRLLWLAHDFGYKPGIDSYLSSRLALTSNRPDDPTVLDQANFECAWIYLWQARLSTSLGLDVKNLFIDRHRDKQWLTYSPTFAVYWMNQSLLQHPLFFSLKSGMDAESERAELLVALETVVGSARNAVSLSAIKSPFLHSVRSEVFHQPLGAEGARGE